MWRSSIFTLTFVLVLIATKGGRGQDSARPAVLFSLGRSIQFEVVMGRLRAINAGRGKCESTTACDPHSNVRESYSLTLDGSVPSIHYELRTPDEQLCIDFTEGQRVEIHRQAPGSQSEPATLHFTQDRKGNLTLVLEDAEGRQQYSANTFWHLILAEPEVCRQHLLPILECLRPHWRLAEQAASVENRLLDAAASGDIVSRSRLDTLVAQLRSNSFQQRQAADRTLREMGQSVLCYVDQLDRRKLDGEQRLRLEKIIDAASVETADTPRRVATWLVDDKAIWLAMLSNEQSLKRQVAVEQLSRLCGQPIHFDSQAVDALRRAQIKRLRSQLVLDQAATPNSQ